MTYLTLEALWCSWIWCIYGCSTCEWWGGKSGWGEGKQPVAGTLTFSVKGNVMSLLVKSTHVTIWSHLGFLALWSFIPFSPFFLHCIHLKMLHRKDICLRCGEIHLSHSLYCLLLQCLKARTRRLKFTNINSNVRKLNSSRTREAKTYFPHGHLVSHLPCLFPQRTYGATVCFLALLQSNWFSQKHLRIKIGLYK